MAMIVQRFWGQASDGKRHSDENNNFEMQCVCKQEKRVPVSDPTIIISLTAKKLSVEKVEAQNSLGIYFLCPSHLTFALALWKTFSRHSSTIIQTLRDPFPRKCPPSRLRKLFFERVFNVEKEKQLRSMEKLKKRKSGQRFMQHSGPIHASQ